MYTIKYSTSSLNSELPEDSSNQLICTYSFTLPYEAVYNNATTVSDDKLTYTWDMSKNSNIELSFRLDGKNEETKVNDENILWAKASSWAEEELRSAKSKNLIPAFFNGADLTTNISRKGFAHVAVKLYEALSGNKALSTNSNPFVDCNDIEVLKAYNLGITAGMSASTFEPDALITREQMATMMYRTIKISGADTTFDLNSIKVFDDDLEISDWAKESVYFMAKNGIIQGIGNNKFDPKGNARIEEAIAISSRDTIALEGSNPTINDNSTFTSQLITSISNSNIESIMNWDFSGNDKYGEDFDSFLKSENVKLSFSPSLKGNVKLYSVEKYSPYSNNFGIIYVVTSNGELYYGEYVKDDYSVDYSTMPETNVDMNLLEIDKPVVGIDRNVIKYSDGSFGMIVQKYEYSDDYLEETFLEEPHYYQIEELSVKKNLYKEIVFRLLNGKYKIESVTNANGDVVSLNDLGISSVNYLTCGQGSVYGIDNEEKGIIFSYNDLNNQPIAKSAYYNPKMPDLWEDADLVTSFNIFKNQITFTGDVYFKEMQFEFESDNYLVTDEEKIIHLYTKDGYVINARFYSSIEQLEEEIGSSIGNECASGFGWDYYYE